MIRVARDLRSPAIHPVARAGAGNPAGRALVARHAPAAVRTRGAPRMRPRRCATDAHPTGPFTPTAPPRGAHLWRAMRAGPSGPSLRHGCAPMRDDGTVPRVWGVHDGMPHARGRSNLRCAGPLSGMPRAKALAVRPMPAGRAGLAEPRHSWCDRPVAGTVGRHAIHSRAPDRGGVSGRRRPCLRRRCQHARGVGGDDVLAAAVIGAMLSGIGLAVIRGASRPRRLKAGPIRPMSGWPRGRRSWPPAPSTIRPAAADGGPPPGLRLDGAAALKYIPPTAPAGMM